MVRQRFVDYYKLSEKYKAENKRLKDFIELEIDHAEAFSDLPVDSKHSMRAFIIRAKQALKEVK